MSERRIFTPYADTTTNRRLEMHLSPEDSAKIGRGRWGPANVTDLDTGTVLRVRGASCGGDCYCAAEVVEVVSMGSGMPPFLREEPMGDLAIPPSNLDAA